MRRFTADTENPSMEESTRKNEQLPVPVMPSEPRGEDEPSDAGERGRFHGMLRAWKSLPHPIRWIGVSIVGVVIILAGVAMLVLPGPGIVFILLGLAVLATEFAWAQVAVHRIKTTGDSAWSAAKSILFRKPQDAQTAEPQSPPKD